MILELGDLVAKSIDAFTEKNTIKLFPSAQGALDNLSFAAKDIYDIAGRRTGAGNPDWLDSHDPATDTAWVLERLLGAGAALAGVTHCTELTRGIVGDNAHYGTPLNPRAPDRAPGGSSSGSASAVAAGTVDFALGSDTNGSITVPASFCGLWGMKPSRGRIRRDGVFKQTTEFDTVGWFARDSDTLATVGEVLLQTQIDAAEPRRILFAEDMFALVDTELVPALDTACQEVESIAARTVRQQFCPIAPVDVMRAHYVLHSRDAWLTLRAWFERANPRLTFQVTRMFLAGSTLTAENEAEARSYLAPLQAQMLNLLTEDTVLCLPAAASHPWRAGATPGEISESINRTAQLATIGTTIGAPQVTLPIVNDHRALPIGLSLMGAPGSDELLLALASRIEQTVST